VIGPRTNEHWLIGLDDTDMPGTRGTGRLARELAEALGANGLSGRGVTRHQLLVHRDVPYTSHNSAACVGVAGEVADPEVLFKFVKSFIAQRSPEGSDPGVCLALLDETPKELTQLGVRAQNEVLHLPEVRRMVHDGVRCAELAGSGQGIIGALAAVGLRAGGNDGRFVQIGRIRELPEVASVRQVLGAGVEEVRSSGSRAPLDEEKVQTLGWLRPRLCEGGAVVFVEESKEHGFEWIVTDRRQGGSAH